MDLIRRAMVSLTRIGRFCKRERQRYARFGWSELQNEIGWTPMMTAAFHGSVSMVKMLLDFGCPAERVSSTDHSAIMVAALRGHDALVSVLAEHGPLGKFESDRLGYTAMHFACGTCSLATVQLLVGMGANVNAVSLLGATPLSMAQVSGRVETAEYLRTLGAWPGDFDADAKFNTMRSTIPPLVTNANDRLSELLSLRNPWKQAKESRTAVIDEIQIHVFPWLNHDDAVRIQKDVAALNWAMNHAQTGGDTAEVNRVFTFSRSNYRVPYLVNRKGKLSEEAPLYLVTATYADYLIAIFGLIESGVKCLRTDGPRVVF